MGKSNKNNSFLKEKSAKTSFTEHHNSHLGMDVPEDYFTASKATILDLVKEKEVQTQQIAKEMPVFYLRRQFQVAASVAVLLTLTVWFQFTKQNNSEFLLASDDVLIESLFVEEASMDGFIDNILVSEIIVEAENSEQELENLFMNSLFVEDSLLDDYTNKSLINNIVL